MTSTQLTHDPTKPKRLYFKTYLQLVRNSVGTEMFKSFYVTTPEQGEFDAMADGDKSCAFYVSAVLVLFKKLAGIHGTVESTIRDLVQSGWQEVSEDALEPGDVIVWVRQKFDHGSYEHIGFYLGEGRAVSTSWQDKKVIEHDLKFGSINRPIKCAYRTKWQD